MEWIVLLKLLVAHVLGDFVLQPRSWVEGKQAHTFKSPQLYLHTFVHAVLAYIILMDWTNWQVPIFIFIAHTLIDLWKSMQAKNLLYFSIDQFLHLASLVTLTFYLSTYPVMEFWNFLQHPKFLLILLGYILVWRPFAFIIDIFTFQWRQEIRSIEKVDGVGSLEDAGKYIGMLERFLVLTFILSNNPAAIGMLIAAKSILRFNDLKGESSRKMSEYVLIGTLLSFSLCIATGLAIKYLLNLI